MTSNWPCNYVHSILAIPFWQPLRFLTTYCDSHSGPLLQLISIIFKVECNLYLCNFCCSVRCIHVFYKNLIKIFMLSMKLTLSCVMRLWAMLARIFHICGSTLSLFCAFTIWTLLYSFQNEGWIFKWWGIVPLCRASYFGERFYIYYAVVGYKWEKSSSVYKGGEDRSCKSGALWGNELNLQISYFILSSAFILVWLIQYVFVFYFSHGYSVNYKFSVVYIFLCVLGGEVIMDFCWCFVTKRKKINLE